MRLYTISSYWFAALDGFSARCPRWRLLMPLALLTLPGACSSSPPPAAASSAAAPGAAERPGRAEDAAEQPPAPTVLRADTADVLFSFRAEDGSWATTQALAEVPEAAWEQVLLVDLRRSPAQRSSERWVQLADLRQTGPDGTYPVKVLPRRQWEQQLRQAGGAPAGEPSAPTPPSTPQAGPAGAGGRPEGRAGQAQPDGANRRLIMYSTQGCPVCTQARRFLQALKIPFVEKDVERDPAAALELQIKARRAGIPASGVPVFDYRGTLIPGFDKERLLGLLRGI